jgi:hypothetical protein
MTSISAAAPIRVVTTLPKPYLRISTVRGYSSAAAMAGLRSGNTCLLSPGHTSTTYQHQRSVAPKRYISSTKHTQIKDFFPPPQAPHVKEVQSAWRHPVYSEDQMRQVEIAHRETKNWADWVALSTVRVLRWGTDFVTGYRHPPEGREHELAPKFVMNEKKWMTRFIFLETVAGVPGMVGGMLRHLRSLRRMKRDNGWYGYI